MKFKPIHTNQPLNELVGTDYRELLGDEVADLLEDILSDGVFDQQDFERLTCDKKAFSQLRRLHFNLWRYSATDDNPTQLSRDEAREFQIWFRSPAKYIGDTLPSPDMVHRGQQMLYPDRANNDVVIDDLHCSMQKECEFTITDDTLLIVTHPSLTYDSGRVAQTAITDILNRARDMETPIALLVGPTESFDNLYLSQPHANYYVGSDHGEHAIAFAGRELHLIGGHASACMTSTLTDLIVHRPTNEPLIMRIPLDAEGVYDFLELAEDKKSTIAISFRDHLARSGQSKQEYLTSYLQAVRADLWDLNEKQYRLRASEANDSTYILFPVHESNAQITIIFE
jgi:hypothetical protein